MAQKNRGSVKANVLKSTALLAAVFGSSCWTTNTNIHIGNNTVTCTKPIEINGQLDYPCGKCMSCRVQRTQEWAIRLMHEKSSWDSSIFVTLTYSDQHLPDPPLIQKSEVQNFLKRLRRELSTPIKYYASGEYGTQGTCRPHYHLIIFGLSLSDKILIEKTWNKGRVDVGTVTIESCRYVASYIQKKLYKQPNEKNSGLFSLSSQGLGLNWAISAREQLQNLEKITHKGIPMGIPRYYVKKLGLDLSKSQAERTEKVEEEYSELKKQKPESDLFTTNLLSKRQADRNIVAKTNLHEKKL